MGRADGRQKDKKKKDVFQKERKSVRKEAKIHIGKVIIFKIKT